MSIVTNTAYHLTRSSYKRKIITFGVSIFASLSLIATGFASWVLSTGAEKGGSGNVEVGTVTEAAISISNIEFDETTGSTVSFNADDADTSGALRYGDDASVDIDYENMTITFSGTVSNIAILDAITVKMTVPAGVQAAADAGYIVLPECATATNGVTIVDAAIAVEDADGGDAWTWTPNVEAGTADFTYSLVFEWGTAFGGVNPGYYFDAPEFTLPDGEDDLNEYIVAELNNFRSLVLMAKPYEELTEQEQNTLKTLTEAALEVDQKFNVTVTATVN